MGEPVSGPLGEHDRDDDQEEELDVVGDLHHDHGQGHGQPRHPTEEGDSSEEGKCPRIHPVPVLTIMNTEHVHTDSAENPAVEAANEEHGDDQAAGDVGAAGPAGEEEVEDEEQDEWTIAKLQMCVSGE